MSGQCWCGTKNPQFNPRGLERGCGATGFRSCFCGGDQCVCHYHGGIECDGCEDCLGLAEDDYGDEPEDPDR